MFTIINNPKLTESQKCKAIEESFNRDPLQLTLADLAGKTPLHHAVSNNLPEVVKLLLKLGTAANAADKERKPRNIVNATDHMEQTPLHYAASAGYSDLIWILGYYEGCEFNAQDSLGETPFYKATDYRQPQCMTSLQAVSKFGIDKKLKNIAGHTAEDIIHSISNPKTQNALAEAFNIQPDMFGRSPLQLAIINGSSDLVKMHIESGAPHWEIDKYGRTAVHYAVLCNNTRLLLYLCHQNFNLDQTDFKGYTALHHSIEIGSPDSVKILVTAQKPASRTVKNHDGKMPAELISWKDKDNALELKKALKCMPVANIQSPQYEKELFPDEPTVTSGYRAYLQKNFKELDTPISDVISPRLSDTSSTKGPLRRRYTSFGKQQKEPTRSKESLESKIFLEQKSPHISDHSSHHKSKSPLEKAYEKNDISAVLKQIKKASKNKLLHELQPIFYNFIEKHQDEPASLMFLQAICRELQPQIIEEEADFDGICTLTQKSLLNLLLSEGLKIACRLEEINLFKDEDLASFSDQPQTQNLLKTLVGLCSGTIVGNDVRIDLNNLRQEVTGLHVFVDPQEIITLLINLNPQFSNIQRLQSHYIVFTLINIQPPYGYNCPTWQLDTYLTTCCSNTIASLISKHNKSIADYKIHTIHSFIEPIKLLITKLIPPQKIDIFSKIDEFVNQKSVSLNRNKSLAPLISFVAREFNIPNAKFYQTCMLKEFRNKCWDEEDKLQTHPTLLEHSKQFNLTRNFVINTILSYTPPLQKAHALTLFILVARESFHSPFGCDLPTIMATATALSSPEIEHLKEEHDLLEHSIVKTENALLKFASPGDNYKYYRGLVASEPHVIPFLGVIFKDKIYSYEYPLNTKIERLAKIHLFLIALKKRLADVPLNSQSDLMEKIYLCNDAPEVAIEATKTSSGSRKGLKPKADVPSNSQSDLMEKIHLCNDAPEVSIEAAKTSSGSRKCLKPKNESLSVGRRLSMFGGTAAINSGQPSVSLQPEHPAGTLAFDTPPSSDENRFNKTL